LFSREEFRKIEGCSIEIHTDDSSPWKMVRDRTAEYAKLDEEQLEALGEKIMSKLLLFLPV